MILHPPTPTPFPYTTLFRSSLSLVGVEPRDHATVLAPHAGNVGDEHEEPRPEACRDRAGRRIAVHVEDLAGDAVERGRRDRSEEHTSELQSRQYLVCRLLLE